MAIFTSMAVLLGAAYRTYRDTDSLAVAQWSTAVSFVAISLLVAALGVSFAVNVVANDDGLGHRETAVGRSKVWLWQDFAHAEIRRTASGPAVTLITADGSKATKSRSAVRHLSHRRIAGRGGRHPSPGHHRSSAAVATRTPGHGWISGHRFGVRRVHIAVAVPGARGTGGSTSRRSADIDHRAFTSAPTRRDPVRCQSPSDRQRCSMHSSTEATRR